MVSCFKQPAIRSRAYLAAAKDQPCIRCGREDKTTVAAHYCGLGAHQFGKGGSRKAGDLFVADLCHGCHSEMDSYAGGNTIERSQEFLKLILLTVERRIHQGVLKL